jgi:hypothetical protein
MGANVFSRPQTQHDPLRPFAQVGAPRSTQPDGDRHQEWAWTSLTRKRSLVQILYGPRFFVPLFGYQVTARPQGF